MKVLIAIVMFLFGLFVGILVVPGFKEFSTPLYLEEEYSTPRIKTLLSGFGITLPLEVSNVNLFTKQDGEKKQLWMKFECTPEVKDEFVAQLTSRHVGLFNRVVETPKCWTVPRSYGGLTAIRSTIMNSKACASPMTRSCETSISTRRTESRIS